MFLDLKNILQGRSFCLVVAVRMNLKNWMTNLDEDVRNIPVIFLSIPGSHDSMTYTINESSKSAPDAQLFVKILVKLFGNIVKRIVLRWSITQKSTATEQLNYGIRFFDLRIATNDTDSNFYITHALFGARIDSILVEINNFLTENKEEIVILDFQHFYGFTAEDHLRLMNLVENIFNEKLCPLPWDINTVTLSWMRDKSYQVISIYRNTCAEKRISFWPSLRYPTPWPHTTSVEELIPFLQSCLAKRYQNKGLVTQCVLTPDNLFVAKHIFSSLKNTCAANCRQAIIPWLNMQHPGVNGVNVVISDFIEFNDDEIGKDNMTSIYKLNSTNNSNPIVETSVLKEAHPTFDQRKRMIKREEAANLESEQKLTTTTPCVPKNPNSGNSTKSKPENPADPGKSDFPADPGKSDNPANPRKSDNPADPGKSDNPATRPNVAAGKNPKGTESDSTQNKYSTENPRTGDVDSEGDDIAAAKLINGFMQSVMDQASRIGNLKSELGLGRKIDVEYQSFTNINKTVTNEFMSNVFGCVDKLVENTLARQVCGQLPPDMKRFLDWLLKSGISKEQACQVQKASGEADFANYMFSAAGTCKNETRNIIANIVGLDVDEELKFLSDGNDYLKDTMQGEFTQVQ